MKVYVSEGRVEEVEVVDGSIGIKQASPVLQGIYVVEHKDGHWLCFSSREKRAMICLEQLAEARGGIVGMAIEEWIAETVFPKSGRLEVRHG